MYDFDVFGDIAVCILHHKARSAKLSRLYNYSSSTLTSENIVIGFKLAVSFGCSDFFFFHSTLRFSKIEVHDYNDTDIMLVNLILNVLSHLMIASLVILFYI